MALHNYESAHNSLPPAVVVDKDGKPLLSWRVMILPYIEHDSLFKQFHLDEPWDSAHNATLLEKMPNPYRPFNQRAKCPDHHTFYRVFTGTGTLFETGVSVDFKTGFPDGLADIFLVVEAGDPVPWTKPDELQVKFGQPLPSLGGVWPQQFKAVMADGDVRTFAKPLNENEMRSMVYRVKPN